MGIPLVFENFLRGRIVALPSGELIGIKLFAKLIDLNSTLLKVLVGEFFSDKFK